MECKQCESETPLREMHPSGRCKSCQRSLLEFKQTYFRGRIRSRRADGKMHYARTKLERD